MDSSKCEFWQRINDELEFRGIDRKVFARDIGISVNTIASGVSRGSKPDVEIALKSSKYFKLSLDYLLYGRQGEEEVAVSETKEYRITHDRDFFSIYRKLELIPEITREPIIRMITEMSRKYEKNLPFDEEQKKIK